MDDKAQLDSDKEIKEFNIESEIPIQFKDLETEGLFWISGYVAFEMRSIQKLGQTTGRANEILCKESIVCIVQFVEKLWLLPGSWSAGTLMDYPSRKYPSRGSSFSFLFCHWSI